MKENSLHIVHNGEIFLADEPLFNYSNRSFCYGDSVFESIRSTGSEIHFEKDHFERLFNALEALKMEPAFDSAKLKKDTQRLINRDKLFGGVRIRITVYRDSKGLYTPQANSCSYIISCQPLEKPEYTLNSKGYRIGIFDQMKKPINFLSSYKTGNSILNVMAGLYAKENQWDDCLILNEKNEIIEGYHSNIFLVKNSVLFTPPVESGCVNGVMRKNILVLAPELGLKVQENISINEKTLNEPDEIFFTNAVEGIRWVLAFKNRRYFNKYSKLFVDKLNSLINV